MRWRRLLGGKGPDKEAPPDAVGPRRRETQRYPYGIKLTAKCSSWPRLIELLSGDVSKGGLFVPTNEDAQVGEVVALSLTLPDGGLLDVGGTVVAVITAEQGARVGKGRGLGIRLAAMSQGDSARFDALLAAARAAAPAPDTAGVSSPPGPRTAPAGYTVSPRTIGIDLGTSYTSVAVSTERKVKILAWPDGERSIPSVLHFPARGKWVLGAEARARQATDPVHTVHSPKRLLGRRYDDRDIQPYLAQAAYKTSPAPDGTIMVDQWGEPYTIVQLCAYVLAAARDLAEKATGEVVRRAVCTVPVSFDDERIRLLKRAGQMVQLEVVATIDEPSAAALANRFAAGFGGVVGVYDFGGGTFDFTVVDVTRGDFQVLATAGDSWLGGDDFDQAIAEAVANRVWHEHNVDLRKQQVEWQRLLFACEKAKRDLSTQEAVILSVPELIRTAQGMVDVNVRVDRNALETVCKSAIDRSLATCREALELVDMKPGDLQAIYLSGGTTYIPAVRSAIQRELGLEARTGVPAEHAVCLGAGIHAAQLQLQGSTTL